MRINFNVSSIVAKNALAKNDARFAESTLKLSSGYKINKASDNAAGLAIARKMNAQIRGIVRANENANDGISVVNTADGAMMEMHSILQRMNELAIQAANGTNSDDDRAKIQLEIDQLVMEIDRIADTTQFNAQTLLDGTFAYKGYTNTENVRVMSSTDGVVSGTYVIGTITYAYTEKKVTSYTDNGTKVGKIREEDSFNISGGNEDNIREALVREDKLDDYKQLNNSTGLRAFPDDSLVTIEDEYIIIKSKGDFEIKLSVNNSESDIGAAAKLATTTTTISKNYTNLVYKGIELDTDLPDLDANPPGTKSFKLGLIRVDEKSPDVVKEESLEGIGIALKEYFAEKKESGVNIKNAELKDGFINITYDNSAGTGNVLKLNFKDPLAAKNKYLFEKEEIKETTYTVGSSKKEDFVAINISGMGPMRVQVGANEGQFLDIEIPDLNTLYLGVDKFDVRTEASATEAINIAGKAINYLSGVRAKVGAYTNRLEQTVKNLETTEENMTASYSRIMDVDMAKEMTEYTTIQVLVQASTSMLAQANERPQQVLQLLQ